MSLKTCNKERMKALYWMIKYIQVLRDDSQREGWEERPRETPDSVLMDIRDFLANRSLEPGICNEFEKNIKELFKEVEK